VLMGAAFIGVMYFMIIRPQQKQQKRQQDLIASLKKGDEVLLTSGIVGRIFSVEDKFITLESAGTKLKVVRQAVHSLLGPSAALSASQDENK
jgi:preprotein translocase subunit YajC